MLGFRVGEGRGDRVTGLRRLELVFIMKGGFPCGVASGEADRSLYVMDWGVMG